MSALLIGAVKVAPVPVLDDERRRDAAATLEHTSQMRRRLLDARLEARLFPRTRLHVRGENLLDRAYEIDAGYPMPGTTWFVGAEVAF